MQKQGIYMHAAVMDIDLVDEQIQDSITEETKEAFVLVRWKKRPIGHLWLPVVDIMPQSLFSKAIQYARNHETELKVF